MEIQERQKVEQYADQILYEIKMNRDLKGYKFLRTAVILRYLHPEYQKNIYRGLFPKVAQMYGVKVSSVERNIRTVLESTWTNAYADAQYKYYDHIISYGKDKPTAAKFIEETVAMIGDRMKH